MHRRSVLTGLAVLAGSPLLISSAHAQAEELIIMWIARSAAEGAVSYLGGKALSSVLTGDGQPTNTDVINAIKNSQRELEIYIHADIRSAFAEQDLQKLAEKAETTRRVLLAFSNLSPRERRARVDYIQYADSATRGGIVASEMHTPASLPLLAIFISLRTMTVKLRHEYDGLNGPYSAYKDELTGYFHSFWSRVVSFSNHMFGDRVGPLQCNFEPESGPGFHISNCRCTFSLDGKVTAATTINSPAQGECSILNVNNGNMARNQTLIDVDQDFVNRIKPKVILPLGRIATTFFEMARDWPA